MSWAMYELFENGNYISEEDVKLLTDYNPNRSYYQCQYNYATKLYHVCKWRKRRGLRAIAKKRETICGGKLVNFFAYKAHKNCICLTV